MHIHIPAELQNAHSILSNCSVKFLEFVKNNPESLKACNYGLLEWDEKLFVLQPWPTFVSQERRREMEQANLELLNLIRGIPQRVFGNDEVEMSRYFDIPREKVKWCLKGVTTGHMANLLARGDFAYSPGSGWKCIEHNVTASLGGLQISTWESLYLRTPVISKFFQEYRVKIQNKNLVFKLVEHVLKIAVQRFGTGNEINIAVVSKGLIPDSLKESHTYLDEMYRNMLWFTHKQLKGKFLLCGLPDLRTENDQVFYKNDRIHAVIEMYNGEVPGDILNAFAAGNLLLFNGPVSELLSNKLNLAVLSEQENSNIFSAREQELIKKYIPWTRKVTPGLENFILTNRERLVIKPGEGYGGFGISIGKKCTSLQWEDAVKQAVKGKNFLVQEYIESFPYLYQYGDDGCAPHDAVWGVFVFGSVYGGAWVRVVPRKDNSGVINCHQGAKVSVVFEVQD
jgi:hypothetical protein